MSTLDTRPPRADVEPSAGDSDREKMRRRAVPERVHRLRRRWARLRRTLVVALSVVLVGTAFARAHEDPGTVLATGASVRVVAAKGSAAMDPADQADDVARGGPGDAALVQPSARASGPAATPATPAAPLSPTTVPSGAVSQNGTAAPAPLTPAPAATTVPDSGAGTVTPVEIPDGPVKATGRTVTYAIDVEDGLPQSAQEFAEVVHDVLIDPRGWQTEDDIRFVPVAIAERTAGAHVDIRITLASPATTQKLCAPLDVTSDQVSCWNGSRSVINLTRWVDGADTYGADLTSYRDYLISHEVGHGLGYQHVHCPGPGQRAPVMVQQTKSLEGCVAWPWPHQT